MKHIIPFNENKNIQSIEDMLLIFRDTGELEDNHVELTRIGNIYIDLDFNREIRGMNKLILVDKIINRLRRKYTHVSILDNMIFIIPDDTKPYDKTSLVDKCNEILNDGLSDLKKYTSTKAEFADQILYGKTPNEISIQYYYKETDKFAYIVYLQLWKPFNNNFMLDEHDISIILKDAIEKKLNIELDSVHTGRKDYTPILEPVTYSNSVNQY